MKNYPLLLLLFCCTLFFSACSDDDDATPSKEDMLKNKRWQITALNATSPLPLDLYSQVDACFKDNYLEFEDNGVLVINEGATKCQTASPQQIEGTWSLNGDILTLSGLGASLGLPIASLTLTITDLSNTRFVASFENQTVTGFPLPVSGTVTMQAM